MTQPTTTIALPVEILRRLQAKLVLAVIFHLIGGLFLVALALGSFNSAPPAPTGPTPAQQAQADHASACLLGGNKRPADCPTPK